MQTLQSAIISINVEICGKKYLIIKILIDDEYKVKTEYSLTEKAEKIMYCEITSNYFDDLQNT